MHTLIILLVLGGFMVGGIVGMFVGFNYGRKKDSGIYAGVKKG